MREWLSGGAPPCQGGGRGFDPRLALFYFSGNADRISVSVLFLSSKKWGQFGDTYEKAVFFTLALPKETIFPSVASLGLVSEAFDNAFVSIW